MSQALISPASFYRWENGHAQRLGNLPKVTVNKQVWDVNPSSLPQESCTNIDGHAAFYIVIGIT